MVGVEFATVLETTGGGLDLCRLRDIFTWLSSFHVSFFAMDAQFETHNKDH